MRHATTPSGSTPSLEPGLSVVDVPSHRSTALHEVAINAATERDGNTLWVDARNNAVAQLLRHPESRRRFMDINLARAFTAYQHHELIRTLPGQITERTSLIVAPCLTSLYQDDDVPSPEDMQYMRASAAILAEIADTFDLPVLVSCIQGAGKMRDVVGEYTSREIAVEETDMGYRFESDDFETLVYWHTGYWQTTIPYWVDLLGAVDEGCLVEAAVENGLFEATV